MTKITFFDLETTGTSLATDEIVQIAIVQVDLQGNVIEEFSTLINPSIPISDGAYSIHGISMDDVKDAPKFKDIAEKVFNLLNGNAIGGHNITRFDIPIITRQLAESGFIYNAFTSNVIDTYMNETVIHPRTLKACYERYYEGSDTIKFHDALDDVRASIAIMKKQVPVIKSKGLSMTDIAFNGTRPAESSMSFVWKDNEVIFNFGKHKGKVARYEKEYLNWYLTQSIPQDTRLLVEKLIQA